MWGIETLLSTLAGGISLLVLFRRIQSTRPSLVPKSVALVVLGDIGRSPRMMYHAESLARNGYTTHIVAYRGSAPPKHLLENPHMRFVYLPTPLGWVSGLPRPLFLLCLPLKVIVGAWDLLRALVSIQIAPAFLFVQNPPAIPTLIVVKLAAFLRGSKVIIDWHNTGYSVLALRLGRRHPVVLFAKFLELLFGRLAYAHLTVSDAMKHELISEANLRGRVVTFHDRPPATFRRLEEQEAHNLFSRLPSLNSLSEWEPAFEPDSTLFTTASGSLRAYRPALLVSSTSWTADEDFSILLRALELYETAARKFAAGEGGLRDSHGQVIPLSGKKAARKLPKIVVLVTGKGAGKKAFEADVERLERKWDWVRARTEWLEREDYPRLLGSADLGVSLHTSTSGIDLPMKVVDMFGCGLPVLALDFPCLGELIKDGKNGRTFETAEDLADELITLLLGFPMPFPSDIDILRVGIKDCKYGGGEPGQEWESWEAHWDRIVAPLMAP
ncbi:beta-1,4-mannosyltransferase, glycosyltransferase family 33 protein [Rhodotorula toruloides]|uniref:Chitobiosyldiphosphodolichol beta-mannosyltransferase n=1 Tax=Rhodotorula toruloides TaxID=5286 RepID=A0A511KLW5_RHOTO|nr:beta-1,4-mannosyltransferase, glycosyltransferase family 33 protein [Rhodotorula toruloides]